MESKFTLSIDWEDFGQLLCKYNCNIITPPLNSIDRQTEIILDLLDESNTKATFFILGMAAKYKPNLIQKIDARRHEIALHGNSHTALFNLSKEEVKDDIVDNYKLITDIIGKPIYGYRAPFFSINSSNLFVLEILSDLGLVYDSSIFPIKMPRYGISDFITNDELYELPNSKTIVELPLTVTKYFSKKWPISGGGYMRLMPKYIVKKVFNDLSALNSDPMIYMHPYEFDTQKIDSKSNFPNDFEYSRLKYILLDFRWNLFRNSIHGKIKHLLTNYNFVTCKQRAEYVKDNTNSATVLG